MEHAQCADVICGAVIVNYHSAIPGRSGSFRVDLNVHTHRVSGLFWIGLGVHRFCIRFTEQAFQHEWRAECIHNLCLARRLGARCNLSATTGDCRGYMRGVQRGWLGEERYFLVVPVDEDLTRRREDVGGATLRGKKDWVLSFGEEKGRDGLWGGVL
jgi:hypothetical protein